MNVAMAHRCLVCKYSHTNLSEGTSVSIFFDKEKVINIHLCPLHSIDYFKLGQLRFFRKFSSQIEQLCLPEDVWILNYLREQDIKHPVVRADLI